MDQFKFEPKLKTTLFVGMGLGAICLLLSYFSGEYGAARFWSNLLHNSVFFTGIAFISLFVTAAFILTYSGWYVVMKRVWEAYYLFLVPGLILMIVIIAGLWLDWHHIYHWADEQAVNNDKILKHKSSFLNKGWYTFGTLIVVGAWIFIARKLRQLSVEEDKHGTPDWSYHNKMRVWASVMLPVGAFSSAALIWQWVMSIDAHWYSTLFAWYSTASLFVATMAVTIVTLVYLKSKGYYKNVNANHFHDLGKYMFGFSVFWTYLWFSQYMLIWYANVGEETVYFKTRMDHYPVLFYANLIMNFLLPFLILMRNDTKRKNGTLVFTSLLVFLGHWLDFFLMMKPGVLHTYQEHNAMHHAAGGAHEATAAHAHEFLMGFSIPGFLEFGVLLGFLAFFVYFFMNQLAKAPLEPQRDPYYEESLHHAVWPFESGDGSEESHHH